MIIILFFIIIFHFSCEEKTLEHTTISKVTDTITKKQIYSKRKINGKSKLLKINDKYTKLDTIRFYNSDGSLWYKFTFFYDDSDGKFEYYNPNFKPFAFHPDYFLLVIRIINENDSLYEVEVNESISLIKKVKKNITFYDEITLGELVLSSPSITIDLIKNTIYNDQDLKVKIDKSLLNGVYAYFPLEINGDLLKIKWKKTTLIKKVG